MIIILSSKAINRENLVIYLFFILRFLLLTEVRDHYGYPHLISYVDEYNFPCDTHHPSLGASIFISEINVEPQFKEVIDDFKNANFREIVNHINTEINNFYYL